MNFKKTAENKSIRLNSNNGGMNLTNQQKKDIQFLNKYMPPEFKKDKTLLNAFINGFTPSVAFRNRLKEWFYPKISGNAASASTPTAKEKKEAFSMGKNLPTGRGSTESLFKLDSSPRLGKPKSRTVKPSREAVERKDVKTAKPKPKKPPTGRGSTESLFKLDSSPRLGKPVDTRKRPTGAGGDKSLMPKQITIKKGDTLSSIAKKYNTTVSMLKAANNIKDANKIRAGAKLKIYKGKAKPEIKSALPPSLKGKPRTISAARRAGEKYFFDKKGDKKIAVTKEELKKSGLTLAQWLKKKK